MGLYVAAGDKRNWLERNKAIALPANRAEAYDHAPESIPVAYVDNGHFDAIAILFNKTEAKRFVQGRRDADFYLVDCSAVKEWLA